MVLATAELACGGHTERTLRMRTALDAGDPRGAITALNEELKVSHDEDLPAKLEGDNALLVLDRGSIQQSLLQFKASQRDFEAADQAVDMLDLSRNATDDIAKYIFSDSAGRYKAPPYEKLLINTLDMLNYLELGDLNGARIEARRLAVMQKYYREHKDDARANAILGFAGFLSGYTFERSGNVDDALRWYDDALAYGSYGSLRGSVASLLTKGAYTSPTLRKVVEEGVEPVPLLEDTEMGEVLLIVGFGRVPHKISNRVPIGLALTYVSGAIHPGDAAAANKLAAQGLVTWVNFPSLGPEHGGYEAPLARIDRYPIPIEQAVDVSAQVRHEWKKIEGQIILSAITRMIARYAVGSGVAMVAGKKDSIVGFLASLAVQGTLTALDTPDTRSWETLPARIGVARVRVAPGKHTLVLDARGVVRREEFTVEKGQFIVRTLMALR